MKHGVPQGSVLGPLLFLIYINDLSLCINKLANPIVFADDTSIIISNTNPEEFRKNINLIMTEINKWFQSNLITVNLNKTHFMQFWTKKQYDNETEIIISTSVSTNIYSIKFLGLTIDNLLSWKDHIDVLSTKLNKACYAITYLHTYLLTYSLTHSMEQSPS